MLMSMHPRPTSGSVRRTGPVVKFTEPAYHLRAVSPHLEEQRMPRVVTLVLALVCALALVGSAGAETRVALVVGNSAYAHTTPLSNPLNDAKDMTAALKHAGFDVVEALDADKHKLDGALRSFAGKLTGADVALFFYAGHGLQVGLQNYLVPTDAKLERERDLQFEAVSLDFILRQMEIEREGKTTIVILDACRDNPLARNLARSMGTRSTAVGRGLAAASTGLGTFIAYATQPGNVALDGSGRNSPFTASLTRHMAAKGRNLNATMIEVRKDVVAATDGRQVPWDHSALTGDFYFVAGDVAPAPGTVSAAPAGSSADLVVLQERLRKLEEEAKARNRASAPGAMMTADGIKLAELRARAANLDDLVKDLQKKLMKARMEEGQASNPNDRMKLQRTSMDIQREWTLRGMELRKLREEIAALEGRVASGAAEPASRVAVTAPPPVTPAPRIAKTSPNFDLTENVRLEGPVIRSFKASNPPSCREACEKDEDCVGFQHGRKIPVMGQCDLFSAVTARHEDLKWRSGLRKPQGGADGGPIRRPQNAVPTSRGFITSAGHTIDGEVEKQAQAGGISSCLVVCFNTPGCMGATYDPDAPQAHTCTVFRSVSDLKSREGATAILHPDAVAKE